MRSPRPTPRVPTPTAPALKAGTGARVNVGGLPSATPSSSAASQPKISSGPMITRQSAAGSQRTTDAAPHPSLIALAQILGRQAGRDWLKSSREGGSNGE